MNARGMLCSLASSLVPTFLSLALMPFYLRVLGKEGLGLVATLTLSLMVFGVFSTGAARLLQREIVAACSAGCESGLRQIVRRGWRLYLGLAVIGIAIMVPISRWAAEGLQRSSVELPQDQIERCFYMMLAMAGLTFVYGYAGVILVALGSLAGASVVTLAVSLVTAALTVTLLQIWPRVDVFYGSQTLVLSMGVLAAVLLCGRSLSRACATINIEKNSSERSFTLLPITVFLRQSATLVSTEGINVLITQLDKFLVSFMLPLSAMGSYNLGAAMSRFGNMVFGPLSLAVSPSVCRLESGGYSSAERAEYLWRITFVAMLLMSVVCLLMWGASSAVLHLWVRDQQLDMSEPVWVLRWLVLGHALVALGSAFYNYTVACGHLKLGLMLNIAAMIVLPLPGVWAVRTWGLMGASLCWTIYGLAYLLISIIGARRCGLLWEPGKFWMWRGGAVVLSVIAAGIALHFLKVSDFAKVGAAACMSLFVLVSGFSLSFGIHPRGWMSALDLRINSQTHRML